MKIVNVIGGLGNQMFCYAFAKALLCRHQGEVLVDVSHFNQYNLHDGFQIDEIFNVPDISIAESGHIKKVSRYFPHYGRSRIMRKILPVKKTEFIEKRDYTYDNEALNIIGDTYYEGYWQSPFYFAGIETEVKKMFTFPEAEGKNKELELKMRNVTSVSIHVRRGDYLNARSFVGICELEYYVQAINLIKEKVEDPVFFIFSNDVDWCYENISPLLGASDREVVNHNSGANSYWDMYLMSCCKNMIIANSSFSWWAAFLNNTKDPLVIAPSRWVNRDYTTNIHLDSWLII